MIRAERQTTVLLSGVTSITSSAPYKLHSQFALLSQQLFMSTMTNSNSALLTVLQAIVEKSVKTSVEVALATLYELISKLQDNVTTL